MLEEDNHMPAADRFFEQLKVEVPQRSPGNDRQRLPVEMMLEDGCLATRRPSPASMRSAYSGEVGHRFRWMWAGVRRASRWGKDIMPEVAHLGQAESGITSSSRLHHFVSVISFG
jgi:hypothetical protein